MKKQIAMLLMLLGCLSSSRADNSITVSAVSIPQGGSATISIGLDNDAVVKGFQMDLALPEGVTYVANAKGSRLGDDYDIATSVVDGKQRFIATSSGNTPIADGDGSILEVTVQAAATLSTSTALQATLSGITLASPAGKINIGGETNIGISIVDPSCTVTVANVSVEKGSTATINVALENDVALTYLKFDLALPEGFSYVSHEKGTRAASHTVSRNSGTFIVSSLSNAVFTGSSGTVLSITVQADASLDVGTQLNASIGGIQLVAPDQRAFSPDAANFTLTIVEPTYTELNENSTTAPVDEDGANVRVTRTLTPNVWNTICLPFAMTEAQVKTAFGNDVQLGDFKEYDITVEGSNIVDVEVKFDPVTSIEANHPYIIKVSSETAPFVIESVDVEVDEAPCVQYTNGLTGKQKEVYGTFMGNYVAGTAVPNKCLFLNDNKFYYSTGATTMKAFRGYFDFTDILTSAGNSLTAARMYIVLDGEATAVETVRSQDVETGVYYNLQGVAVENPGKGLYIKDGKKVIIK